MPRQGCEHGRWLVGGWHVTVAYVLGFFVMLAVIGWHPDPPHKKRAELPAPTVHPDPVELAKLQRAADWAERLVVVADGRRYPLRSLASSGVWVGIAATGSSRSRKPAYTSA